MDPRPHAGSPAPAPASRRAAARPSEIGVRGGRRGRAAGASRTASGACAPTARAPRSPPATRTITSIVRRVSWSASRYHPFPARPSSSAVSSLLLGFVVAEEVHDLVARVLDAVEQGLAETLGAVVQAVADLTRPSLGWLFGALRPGSDSSTTWRRCSPAPIRSGTGRMPRRARPRAWRSSRAPRASRRRDHSPTSRYRASHTSPRALPRDGMTLAEDCMSRTSRRSGSPRSELGSPVSW